MFVVILLGILSRNIMLEAALSRIGVMNGIASVDATMPVKRHVSTARESFTAVLRDVLIAGTLLVRLATKDPPITMRSVVGNAIYVIINTTPQKWSSVNAVLSIFAVVVLKTTVLSARTSSSAG